MNEFVDPPARGFELAPGFSDLIDVLRWRGENYFLIESLADLERHLTQLLQSPAQKASIWIECRAASVCVAVVRTNDQLKALTFVPREEVKIITALLDKAGIQSTKLESFIGPPFSSVFVLPLSAHTAQASMILSRLFREVHLLPRNAILVLQHHSLTPSGPSPSLRN